MPAARPLLSPAVRRLWRDRETLQLGRPPGPAVVLAGIGSAVRSLLALLDGTRDRAAVLRDADCPPETTTAVLTLLDRAGLLADAAGDRSALAGLERAERDRLAPDVAALQLRHGDGALTVLRRRRDARVVVAGAGRLGAPLALLLATAGVGAVDVVDEGFVRPEDCGAGGLSLQQVGQRRADATRTLLAHLAPSVRTTPVVSPDLVLLAPAAGLALPEAPGGAPHLLVHIRDGTGVVGPLVRAGISACLHCLDLARTDLDPDWPALAAQLTAATGALTPCDGVLALAVAAQAAQQALTHLDGVVALPASLGGTLELTPPDWRWRRRSWQLHPACGCAWRDTG